MNYKEAREYIKKPRNMGLFRDWIIYQISSDKLGNPQNELEVIHIAGTNGKGSVGAFVEQIFD